MKLLKIIPTVITIFFSFGCSHNDELIIKNKNGGIAETYSNTYDTNLNIKYMSYHINGSIKEEGFIHSGERVGAWKQYYSDGTLRWQGIYVYGRREKLSIDSSINERTRIQFQGYTKDNYYAFRFVLPDSISPDEFMYTYNDAKLIKIFNFDSCDFLIKPLNNDSISLQIYINTTNGVFNVFSKKINPSMLKKWKD